MVKRLGKLDDQHGVVAVKCTEPDYSGYRVVRFVQLSRDKIREYYEKMKDFDVLFNDWIRGNPEAFTANFLRPMPDGRIGATGLIWEVDDVGILFLTDIIPGATASAHFTFWDRRLTGRQDLVKEFLAIVMDELHFRRVEVEIPLYAYPLFSFVEEVGFKKEGRKRSAVLYKEQWFDTNLYSVIKEDYENGSKDREGTEGESGDTTSAGLSEAATG